MRKKVHLKYPPTVCFLFFETNNFIIFKLKTRTLWNSAIFSNCYRSIYLSLGWIGSEVKQLFMPGTGSQNTLSGIRCQSLYRYFGWTEYNIRIFLAPQTCLLWLHRAFLHSFIVIILRFRSTWLCTFTIARYHILPGTYNLRQEYRAVLRCKVPNWSRALRYFIQHSPFTGA